MADEKPTLLIAKGVMSRMGGAERDLLRRLPHLTNWYDISVATLSSCFELESICEQHEIKLYKPEKDWVPPQSPISQIFDSVHKSSKNSWLSCKNLISNIDCFDYFHVISGDGYLAMLQLIPIYKTTHLYLLEPHRGYHEDSLHRNLFGKLRRPKIITNLFLSKGRKNDLSIVKEFSLREKSIVSGNSSYTTSRIKQVYGIDCGYIHPCVDSEEYSRDVDNVTNPFTFSAQEGYVVTIGTANWAKGSMEVVSMLSGTDIALAHVGGGTNHEIAILKQHANDNNVKIWIAPRLSSQQLSILIKQSLAVVSMAHKEPFGLTPIEAYSIGTPAIFVNDGGFIDSIVDGETGRLISRTDISKWHEALSQARVEATRELWTHNGRLRIQELKLSPYEQAEKLHLLLQRKSK